MSRSGIKHNAQITFSLLAVTALCFTNAAIREAPLNVAAYVGDTVVLRCSVVEGPPASRVMWGEFVSSSAVSVISDNDVILGHPNAFRYRIIHDNDTVFDLEISDIRLSDGGRYMCQDTLSGAPEQYRGQAELIVIDADPTCVTTLPTNGIVLDGSNYTSECIINYQGTYPPSMTWTGPEPHIVGNAPPNPSQVWSGVAFTTMSHFDEQAFSCKTNFSAIENAPPDMASNAPTYEYTYTTPKLSVNWGPRNLDAFPRQDYYLVGDQITCRADGRPTPQYHWQNMRTLEIFQGNVFNVTAVILGFNQTLRCRAQNLINEFVYTQDIFVVANVPVITPPTSPPTSPSTTPPPAEAPCFDLTGHWVCDNPYSEFYLQTIFDSEISEIRGIIRNATETVWVEAIGTVRRENNLYIGLTTIWPYINGITGLTGECHRCHGTEVIMAETLLRSASDGVQCVAASIPKEDGTYNYYRKSSSTAKLQQEEFDVYNPTKEISGRLGINLKRR